MEEVPVVKVLTGNVDHNLTYAVKSGDDSRSPIVHRTPAHEFEGVPAFTQGIPDEQRLMNFLFQGYEKTVRPVHNASTPVVIRMGLTLTQIFDMVSKETITLLHMN